ncbi:MAG: hypothetical protein RR794_04680 [Raoultibacter sp.]
MTNQLSGQRKPQRKPAGENEGRRTKARPSVHRRQASTRPSRASQAGRVVRGEAAIAPQRSLIFALAAIALVVVVVLAAVLLLRGAVSPADNPQAASPRVVTAEQSGASALVEVALDELDSVTRAGDVSAWRAAYTQFAGQSSSDPWSTAFVAYCGNLCGFVESSLMPQTASAAEFRAYFEDDASKGVVRANDGSYTPQLGDIMVLSDGAGQRLGIIESFDAASNTLHAIEGDVDGSVAKTSRSADASVGWFITPAYPAIAPAPLDDNELIYIPAGLGAIDAYEGWSLITDPTSPEHQLRMAAGERYDSEGFGVINGCYVIAVRPLYGSVGDYLTFTFVDGSTITCIIGDVKGEDGEGVNEWGFLGGENILEFVVDKESWYGGHENPGTPSCHPEWGQCIASCTNTGNYWGM